MNASRDVRPLRRSLFFVPGSDPRKLEKARTLSADTLLLDLEDSVAIAEKSRARDLVSSFVKAGGAVATEIAVRINPPGTPFFDEDLAACVLAGAQAILLPKSQRPDDIARVSDQILRLEASSSPSDLESVRLMALVETALGITRVAELGRATSRVDALCFGHADFSRDMGLVDADASRGAVLHARCCVAIAARAADVTAIDTVFLDVRDAAGFREDTRLGAELGFEGKLCIHPTQIEIANEIHSPADEQIRFAQRVVQAAHEASVEGRGVFAVDGKMVDEPLVAAQRRVLARAERIGRSIGSESPDE